MKRTREMFWLSLTAFATGIVGTAHAQLDIGTEIGNGADAEIANDDPVFGAAYADIPYGGLGSMNTRFLNSFAPIRHRASLMRFDISGVSGDLSEAGLTVHSVESSRIVNIYALNDSSEVGLEDWDESTVTYNTAPGIINQGSGVVAGAVDPSKYTFLSTWRVPGPSSAGGPQPPGGVPFGSSFVSTTYPEPAMDVAPETVYTDPIDIDADFSANLSNLVAADTNGLLTLLFYPVGDSQSEGNVALRTKDWANISDPENPGGSIPNPDFVISPTLNLPNATLSAGGLVGDYNGDGLVDAADYTVWRDNVGGNAEVVFPDGTRDPSVIGPIGQDDYDFWVANYGTAAANGSSTAVPEPAAAMLLSIALACGVARRR